MIKSILKKFGILLLWQILALGLYITIKIQNINIPAYIYFGIGYFIGYKYLDKIFYEYQDYKYLLFTILLIYFTCKFRNIMNKMDNKKQLVKRNIYIYDDKIKKNKVIEPYETYIICVELENISENKFLKKPFDSKYSEIMLNISKKIIEEYNPLLINLQYNEINIVFRNKCKQNEYSKYLIDYKHLEDGIIPRITNNISDFINKLFEKEIRRTYLKNLKLNLKSKVVFISEENTSDNEILKYLIDKSNREYFRNSVKYYSNTINNFQNQPNNRKYGWFIKDNFIELENNNKFRFYKIKSKTLLAYSFKLENNQEFQDIIMDKDWDEIKLKNLSRNYETKILE